MTFNNGRQTFSNYAIPAHSADEVLFTTTTAIVRLATCGGDGLDGGQVRYYQIGWADYGTTGGGTVTRELLPGNYTFEMTFNNGRQTFSNHTVPDAGSEDPHEVLFTTSAVTFDYPGTVNYHQLGWATFVQPTMNLLTGDYTFQFVEDGLTISNAAVTGCSVDGQLEVQIPGLSGIRIEIHKTNGALVTYRNNQSEQSVFDLANGVYDVVLKQGAITKVVEDVIVFGPTTLNDLVAAMTVNLEGLSGVRVEVHADDGAAGNVGGLAFYYNNQSGESVYTVLRNGYDVLLKQGAETKIVDAIDCNGETCSAGDIVASLQVNYEGLSGVRIEVRTADGLPGTPGNLVFYHNNQSGQPSYDVLKDTYDLVFQQGAKVKVVDDVDCSSGETCSPGDFVATLSVNYENLTGVRMEVRTDDGTESSAGGGLVFYYNNQSGEKTYDVLKSTYDLVFRQGAQTTIVDAVDCTTDETCTPGNFVATLTVDYEGLSGVRIEIRADNGDADGSAGELVTYYNNQSSIRAYDLLMGTYDLVFQQGVEVKVVDVDCTGDTCDAGDIVATMVVNYENLSGVRIEVRADDGNVGTPGDLVYYYNNQNSIRYYDVLKDTYDLVFQQGAKVKVVDSVNCTGDICSPGDFVATLTVDYGTLTGVRIEVRTDDGKVGTAGDLVFYHNNQSGVKAYDVLKNHYDVVLTRGADLGMVDAVDCTGNTCTLGESDLKINAPHGTQVAVYPDNGSTPVAVGTVASNQWLTFTDLPIGVYDVVLTQGSGSITVQNVFHVGGTSLDMLNVLKVNAPHGTQLEVRVPGTSDVVATGTAASNQWATIFLVKDVYDLRLVQGGEQKTVENIECTADETTEDQLSVLKVNAPHGTQVEVYPDDGGALVTAGTVASNQWVTLYVVKDTYDLSLAQNAESKAVPDVDNSGDEQVIVALNTLKVKAPHGTQVEVYADSGGGLVTNGTVASNQWVTLYLVQDTYDLTLTQGGEVKNVQDQDCNGGLTTVHQLSD